MKRLISILVFALIITGNNFAQWENIYSNNTWANGASLFQHNNVLFQVGSMGTQKITLRSDDDGTTWTDITSSFPTDLVLNIFSFGNKVYAVMPSVIGQTNYSIYASADNGVTWVEKSKIDRGVGNGAILSMTSDDINLFAVSNKKSIYKSTDEGITWNEIEINYSGISDILCFAAVGNTYLATQSGIGCILSADAGMNWSPKNATTSIDLIYKLGNDIWGIGAGFSGIFKFNSVSNEWENNFIPTSFSMPISVGTNGTQLISTFGDFLTGGRKYYSSEDKGNTWSELTTENIGLKNDIISRYSVTANASYYFAGSWVFANNIITYSIYKLPLQVTSVNDKMEKPTDFELNQNYPNPFNPTTTIAFSISESGEYNLSIYNLLGQKVKTLFDGQYISGKYKVVINANDFSSGTYFYCLKGENSKITKKMTLLK